MEASFENSTNILLQAYLNDKLRHGYCSACAVGNLLGDSYWSLLFITLHSKGEILPQLIAGDNEVILRKESGGYKVCPITDSLQKIFVKRAKALIDKSGYTIQQLARVENAFETAPKGNSDDDWMFNGLMAVVDVLADIHNVDLSVREEIKNPFIKQYELLNER